MYYKIYISDNIEKREYAEGKFFDPFAREQKDGSFLISEELYNFLTTEGIVDFKLVEKISTPDDKVDIKGVPNITGEKLVFDEKNNIWKEIKQ